MSTLTTIDLVEIIRFIHGKNQPQIISVLSATLVNTTTQQWARVQLKCSTYTEQAPWRQPVYLVGTWLPSGELELGRSDGWEPRSIIEVSLAATNLILKLTCHETR